MNCMINDLQKSNSDFTRMKAHEQLIATLIDYHLRHGGDHFIKSIVNRLNSEDAKIRERSINKL